MVVIIDYGMGNLRSVQKALEKMEAEAKISSSLKVIRNAEKLVLPGVGAFGNAMKELRKRRLIDLIKGIIKEGRYFLGLCLGMQLLFTESEETTGVRGLCILEGKVKRFDSSLGLKIPHVGWNQITFKVQPRTTHFVRVRGMGSRFKALDGIENNTYMYFVHSYYVEPKNPDIVVAQTNYGIDFPAIICRNNIYAMQFHPEKSQQDGLKIIENFVRL